MVSGSRSRNLLLDFGISFIFPKRLKLETLNCMPRGPRQPSPTPLSRVIPPSSGNPCQTIFYTHAGRNTNTPSPRTEQTASLRVTYASVDCEHRRRHTYRLSAVDFHLVGCQFHFYSHRLVTRCSCSTLVNHFFTTETNRQTAPNFSSDYTAKLFARGINYNF